MKLREALRDKTRKELDQEISALTADTGVQRVYCALEVLTAYVAELTAHMLTVSSGCGDVEITDEQLAEIEAI
jgi:hypothetical protein